MKKFLIILIALFSFNMALAQLYVRKDQNLSTILDNKTAENLTLRQHGELYSRTYSKNPLIFENWQYARITFKDDMIIDSLLLNVDGDTNALLVKLADDVEPFAIKAELVESFMFYNSPSRLYRALSGAEFEEKNRPLAFYERIYGECDEETAVLKLLIKKFRGVHGHIQFGSISKEDRYDLFVRYYFKTDGLKYRSFNMNKKGYQNLIGKENMESARDILKVNRLRWTDEAALVLLVEKLL